MLRSRRLALVAIVTVLGLSACGESGPTTSPAGTPAVIVLGSGGKLAGAEASANGGAADRSMMIANIDYVYDGAYPDLGTSAPSWTLPAGGSADAAAVARIAAALGLTGEVRALPADQGGGWMVGPADYSDATLTVSTDGMASWWYSPAPSVGNTKDGGCATPGSVGADGSTEAGGGSDAVSPPSDPKVDPSVDVTAVTDPSVGPPDTTDAVSEPIVECEAPTPPANVPDQAAAEAKAKALLADLGLDAGDYQYTSYADEWNANVTAWLMVGGHRSQIQVNVGYGEDGALQWASGSMAVPQAASEYPLVTPEEALARLNDQSGMWAAYGYGYGGVAMARDTVAGAATDAGSASANAADTPVAAPEPMPVTSDSVLVDPMPIPPDTVNVEPITVHLTGVRLDLTMVWAQDGTVWLLPAYTFTSADGGEYTVIAVEDQYIQQPEPITTDTTSPGTTPGTDPGTVDTTTPVVVDTTAPGVVDTTTDPFFTVTEADAAVLVGLTVDEATKVAEGNGWELRVTTIDGEGQMMTDDLRSNRVDVSVTDGTVSAIDFIG